MDWLQKLRESTKTVLLEAAAFNGANIRRTSRVLGLRSEASGRFERGVDVANIVRALDRAAKLLEDMGACTVCPGIVDQYPTVVLPRQISFTAKQVNSFLGTEVPQATMVDILRRLEFDVDVHGEKITVTVPTWRADVVGPADICEEVARIFGYDKIPSTTPSGDIVYGGQSSLQNVIDRTRTILAGIGFTETISYSFTHPAVLDKLNVPPDSSLRTAIPLLNPITDDFPLLRTTLLGGLMETIVRNLSRKNEDMKLFEVGAVYRPEQLPLKDFPQEPLMVCGVLTGRRHEVAWNQAKEFVDFYDAKGAVETLLTSIGISGYKVEQGTHYALHPGKTAVFVKDGDRLAVVGEAHPRVLDAFGLNRPVYLFEITAEILLKHAVPIPAYQPLPRFPAIVRDLAVVLASDISVDRVTRAIWESGGPLLADVKLFDVYTGEQVPKGSRSLAFSLTFRAGDRTLTDSEVEVYYKEIVLYLERTLDAKLRL
ncbi:ferredoxin-fold anticodon-binding [Thermosinus carboxydivorans Nor1]|uniref:Phenylalanine--tRNA ligase beta subunit n=1 Tax=Thermosinus carboxydivorans Nor1 TaxID=401526 RepID=A1HPF9_9FIRM|nr:ferredoxin-fold anticodon-binding [Thermosinus carboxydivorans Nor1]